MLVEVKPDKQIDNDLEAKVNDINTKIIRSFSNDPWYNLALEEHLLSTVSENQIILYLWQNENTVVIGKNQNAWKECACKELESENGKLARRLSGGGAVFHDLGNLNFTFVMDKKLYNLEKQQKVILQAVKNLGIEAELSGRNDLVVNGRKFSGNAFCFKSNSAYHHGTILINTDFTKLVRYLQVSKEKISSKGIDSVKSRVMNLSSVNETITVEAIIRSFKESFVDFYGGTNHEVQIDNDMKDIEELYKKYASWQWNYGETPSFDISFSTRFSWGDIDMGLNLKNAHITSSVIYSDAMDSKLIDEVSSSIIGIPFQLDSIISSIDSIVTNLEGKIIIEDIKRWISTKI